MVQIRRQHAPPSKLRRAAPGVLVGILVLAILAGGAFLVRAELDGDGEEVRKAPPDRDMAAAIRKAERRLEHVEARVERPQRATDKSRDEYDLDAPARTSAFAAGAKRSFSSLEVTLDASIAVAIAPFGSTTPQVLGSPSGRHAWSTIKVPILVTLLRQRRLTALERELAQGALTASDNEAAAALFSRLGGLELASRAVETTLGSASGEPTEVATAPPPPGAVSTYGQTLWSPRASAEFFRALACRRLLGAGNTDYVLDLMAEVTPEQRWGLGAVSISGAGHIGYKGGWGPEADLGGAYLVRQSGVVEKADGRGFAVTLIAQAASGSFESAVAVLNQMASWLAENLAPGAYQPC